ncbi:uncharacterized protein LOC132271127 [Cornus florida]|uniref:uncharacterized protein LOC132271127 n=1 Tax=Cornus florida TaxID=4283 RepID=UPI00289AB088|nr:uncharacterized protein LOC132271127 [Cornus florida]
MHAIKGGWVGQTFALAKPNDSGGRKSRIRRSKEERKAMVESFIKKYQESNNGNFPSLNLTHKEVGGSFYTVREIVRDVIQENRVLGPAKLIPEEQNTDNFLEQYPLGTISTEFQARLSSSNEMHILPFHHQSASENLVVNSSAQSRGPGHQRFDDGKVINGSSQAIEKDENNDETVFIESQDRKSLDIEGNVVEELEASKAKITRIATDVVVETFPLEPVSKITCDLYGQSSELKELNETLEEKETEKVKLEAENDELERMNFLADSSVLVDEKAEVNPAGPLLGSNSGLVDEKAVEEVSGLADEKAVEELGGLSLESSNGSLIEEIIVLDENDGASAAGSKSMNAPIVSHAKDLNSTGTSSSCGQSISKESIVIKNNPDIQHSESSKEGSNPTLDRINLESWEGTSEKSARPETNPLLAFFKSFVAAFVKFWSE